MVTKRIGETAYHLDLQEKGLDGIYAIFLDLPLCPYLSNRLSIEEPTVELDGVLEYEVAAIKGRRVSHAEL